MSNKSIWIWAARNKIGSLIFFEDYGDDDWKPSKSEAGGFWRPAYEGSSFYLPLDLPYVKWEDDEPTKIELRVVEDETTT